MQTEEEEISSYHNTYEVHLQAVQYISRTQADNMGVFYIDWQILIPRWRFSTAATNFWTST